MSYLIDKENNNRFIDYKNSEDWIIVNITLELILNNILCLCLFAFLLFLAKNAHLPQFDLIKFIFKVMFIYRRAPVVAHHMFDFNCICSRHLIQWMSLRENVMQTDESWK